MFSRFLRLSATVALGANVSRTGSITTSTNNEIAFPSAQWTEEPTFTFPAGHVFVAQLVAAYAMITFSLSITIPIRMRVGTATITGPLLMLHRVATLNTATASDPNLGQTFSREVLFRNTSAAAVTSKLSLTIQRQQAGTPNWKLFAPNTDQPITLSVYDLGPAASLPASMATGAPTVT